MRISSTLPALLSFLEKQPQGFRRRQSMEFKLWNIFARMQNLIAKDEGQDLIEYALVVSMIAFAATAAMATLAGNINDAFTSIGTKLTTATG
jgi:pilus assembly protein Flp/PilA